MLIKLTQVNKAFKRDDHWLFPRYQSVLKDVSLHINEGECLGIVGESGSGKSTLGKLILGLEAPDTGKIELSPAMAALPRHRAMSVVFQDYSSSVNPRLCVRDIILEPLAREKYHDKKSDALVTSLLHEVGLDGHMLTRYPHQLSGGQLQRVCIARAIAPNPKFILFDEAVSSLDVSVQVQILELLQKLKHERQLSYLFITHDIAVASFICERLVFFKDGEIVEQLDDMRQLNAVSEPYTRALLDAASYLDIPFLSECKPDDAKP